MFSVSAATPIHSVAVIGAGRLGRAFALAVSQAGFAVALEDVMPANLRRAQDEYGQLLGAATPAIRYALTVEDAVHDADIVIDFVPDELESKLEIFSLLDRMAPPRTVLCTPTRTLSITDLASCTYRAERCIAVRGEAASLAGAEVTLVSSRFVDANTIVAAETFWKQIATSVDMIADAEQPMLVKNLR